MTSGPAIQQLNSRADLLRWYALHAESGMDKAATLAGYVRLPDVEVAGQDEAILAESSDGTGVGGHGSTAPMEVKPAVVAQRSGQPFYYLAEYMRFEANAQQIESGLPEIFSDLEPLEDVDLQPLANEEDAPALSPLAPQNRLRFVLQYYLGQSCSHQLDVPELVRRVATLKPLQQLPRSARRIPAGRVCVMVDKNRRTLPYWQDFDVLCQQIVRQHGLTGLEIRETEDNPFAAYRDWFEREVFHAPVLPAAGSKVLILSDVGLIGRRDSLVQQRWLRFARRLRAAGMEPVLLAPLTPAQVTPVFLRLFNVLIWDRSSRFIPLQHIAASEVDEAGVERLLSLVSVAVHVEVLLLRALIQLLPADKIPAGLEAQVWRHEHVQAGLLAFSVHPTQRAYYQSRFRDTETPALQRQVLALIKQHHASQHPVIWAEEVLQADTLVTFPLADQPWAEQFMRRFTHDFYHQGQHQGMARFARRHLNRFSPAGTRHYSELHSTLFALGYRDKINAGEVIPEYIDAQMVRRVTQQPLPVRQMTLVQCGNELWLQEAGGELLFGLPLATLRLSGKQLLLGKTRTELILQQWNTDQPLAHLDEGEAVYGETFYIDSGLERLELRSMEKPAWAQEIWRDQEGLFAALTFAGERYELSWRNWGNAGTGRWVFVEREVPLGFDRYGLHGDLTLKGVIQRFRFIAPGTFVMGSPQDEPGREPDVSLQGSETQHKVTLTEGFWLADTTVTQRFWAAVTGKNPSHFTDKIKKGWTEGRSFAGANRPVEQISWEDVQAFLVQLNQEIPTLNADFPSEAQWEYACRAGEVTAFNFGAEIDLRQANYSGIFGRDGWYNAAKQATAEVKSYPPNQWGLYEMHGNVWEWCKDVWQQKIPATPVSDPFIGPEAGKQASHRVVRGGSGYGYGRDCRSAFRFRYASGDRISDLGFRLSLGLGATSGGAGSKLAASKTQRVAEQRRGLLEGGLQVLQNLASVKHVRTRVLNWFRGNK